MDKPLLDDSGPRTGEVQRETFCSSTLRHVRSFFACETWYKRYERPYLLPDLIAGATVGVMCVPQSMSYASVAGLREVHGLYAALFGMLPYFFFGTSPHLVTGPTAVMSIIVFDSIPSEWAERAPKSWLRPSLRPPLEPREPCVELSRASAEGGGPIAAPDDGA